MRGLRDLVDERCRASVNVRSGPTTPRKMRTGSRPMSDAPVRDHEQRRDLEDRVQSRSSVSISMSRRHPTQSRPPRRVRRGVAPLRRGAASGLPAAADLVVVVSPAGLRRAAARLPVAGCRRGEPPSRGARGATRSPPSARPASERRVAQVAVVGHDQERRQWRPAPVGRPDVVDRATGSPSRQFDRPQ